MSEIKEKYNLRMDLTAFEDVLPKIPGNTMAAKIRYLISYYEKMEINYVAISGIYGVGHWYPEIRNRYKEMVSSFESKTDMNAYEIFIEHEDEENF